MNRKSFYFWNEFNGFIAPTFKSHIVFVIHELVEIDSA